MAISVFLKPHSSIIYGTERGGGFFLLLRGRRGKMRHFRHVPVTPDATPARRAVQLARTARQAQNRSALLQIRRTTTTAASMQCYFFRAHQSSYTCNAVAPPGRHHMESPPIPDHPCVRSCGIIIPIISLCQHATPPLWDSFSSHT